MKCMGRPSVARGHGTLPSCGAPPSQLFARERSSPGCRGRRDRTMAGKAAKNVIWSPLALPQRYQTLTDERLNARLYGDQIQRAQSKQSVPFVARALHKREAYWL